MPLVIADTWRPLGTGRQAPAGSVRDAVLCELVFAYKRDVAGAYRSLAPDGFATSLPVGTSRVSPKIDGEQWCLHHDAVGATLISPTGRVIDHIPLTDEAHASLGNWCGVLAGELYAMPAHGRPHVADLHAALGGGQAAAVDRLRFAAFDLLRDGECHMLRHTAIERLTRLSTLLPATGTVHHVAWQSSETGADIAAYYQDTVTHGGAEGIVILGADGRIYKVKPHITLDAAVVGYTAQDDGVTDLLLSLMTEDGQYHLIGHVDVGFSREERRQLSAQLTAVSCSSTVLLTNRRGMPYQWVQPTLIVEIRCHEVLTTRQDDVPIRRWHLVYTAESGWQPDRKGAGISLRDAVYLRIRDDKPVTPQAVRWSQVTEWVALPDDMAGASPLPTSTVIRREVYTRPLRAGGTAVRKVLVWQTNKADVDPRYPAYVAQMTDFSPAREEPLHTELRIAATELAIHRQVDDWLAQAIGRGWRCVARRGESPPCPPQPVTDGQSATMPTVSISFARSTSPTFPIVRRRLDALASLGTLTVTANARGVESWFELTVRQVIPAYRRLMNLLNLVRRWKSTEISIDSEVLDRDGMDAFLNRLQEIHACWQHQRSRGPTACRRECQVGCQQLIMIPAQRFLQGAQLREPAWFTVGSFDGTCVTLDKATLLAQVDRARNTPLAMCPHFSRERVIQAISVLPDHLSPESPEYRILYHHDDGRPAWVWPRDVPLPPRLIAHSAQTSPEQRSSNAIIMAPQRPSARQIPPTRYRDVCGQQAAVDAVRELIEIPLKHAHLFAALGATVQPTGVILAGPPGTGKTLLARAIAGECGVHCETVAGPEILSQWVGGSEQALRDIFARAATYAPSLILFDELDSIAPARALVEAHHQHALVAQLLTLLDGMAARTGVYVIGTTNRPESVDPAIRRPGRFDRVVWLHAPDLAGRVAILQHHLQPLHLDPHICDRQALVHQLARCTRGATGAELAYLCQQAVRHCIREAVGAQQAPDAITLTPAHFDQALTTLVLPPERRRHQEQHPAPLTR